MRILASSGRFNRSGSIGPNSIKNQKFRPNLVRALCDLRIRLNNYYKEQFQLENQSVFRRKFVIRFHTLITRITAV